jgi:hypothetical protein
MERFLLFVALGSAIVCGQAPPATGSLTGKVVDATTKTGIRKATVYATIQGPPPAPGNAVRFTPPTIYSTSTDDGGVYRFSGLPLGPVQLRAEKAGHLPQPMTGKERPAIRAGEETAGGELVLVKQAVIAGRVTDLDGEPIERVGVIAIPTRRTRTAGGSMGGQATTDDRGEFRLSRMTAGTYKLMATKQGNDFAISSASVPGEPVMVSAPTYFPSALEANTASEVAVGSGEERTGVEIRMQKTIAVKVAGRVAGDVENVSGVNVSLQTYDITSSGRPSLLGAGMNHFNTMAAPDGRFTIPNVLPGEYIAMANAHRTGPGQTLSGIARLRVGQQDVDQFVIQLQPVARIAGKVVAEGDTKLPHEQVNVSIGSADYGLRGGGGAQVKQDGTFLLENIQRKRLKMNPIAPRGWYLKSLSVGGQRLPTMEFDLTAGDTAIELTYSNKPGAVDVSVDGVTAENGYVVGVAIPDAGNSAPLLTNLYKSVRVSPDRKVAKIEDVPPGNYHIVVCPQGVLEALSDQSVWEKVKSKAVSVKVEEGVTVSASPRLIVESDVEEK